MNKTPTSAVRGSFLDAFLFMLAFAAPALAQSSGPVPSVTVVASQPLATQSQPGVFTLLRAGDTNLPLNVWYELSGTASNGLDYALIPPHLVLLAAGANSKDIGDRSSRHCGN